MIKTVKGCRSCLRWALSVVVAFGVGYIHHKWFYPLWFHGDASAMHVLGKAIFDEGSLLPKDFSYGNQFVFLRSSPFIALAFLLGLRDYEAFVVGSSLSIAFWGGILFLFLNALFKSSKKAILFSVCLLIPFGGWDSDFTLGQQSHLSNAILSLGIVISALKFFKDKNYLFIFLGCLCLFLISAESPIRGLLVLGPLFVVVALIALNLKEFLAVTAPMGFSFLSAYFLNKWLIVFRPISLNYLNVLTFKSSNEIVSNLGKTTAETVGSISSLNVFAGAGLSLLGGIAFSLGLIVILCYFYFVFSGVFKAIEAVKGRLQTNSGEGLFFRKSDPDFLHLTAIVGLIFGALAVAALNPDSSRHYLWAIFVGKLVILKWVYSNFVKFIAPKYSAVLLLASSFLVSMWFASLVKWHWDVEEAIKFRNYSDAVHDIRKSVESTAIRNIYGEDFWRMMPLNTLVDGLNAQALLYDSAELYPFSWLTRPSWSCLDNNVLYYLKDGVVDKVIEDRLIKAEGRKIESGIGYTIWVGPRVWRFPSSAGCFESQLQYDRDSLIRLPSTVGILENGMRVTDREAGFLVFGPYAPLKQGSYELTVFGSSEVFNGTYVDVVSGGGSIVHARFEIKDSNGEFILKNGWINLSGNVSDIEVRLWVGENDEIKLAGYELRPKGKSN